jgi:hypothetical protein
MELLLHLLKQLRAKAQEYFGTPEGTLPPPLDSASANRFFTHVEEAKGDHARNGECGNRTAGVCGKSLALANPAFVSHKKTFLDRKADVDNHARSVAAGMPKLQPNDLSLPVIGPAP